MKNGLSKPAILRISQALNKVTPSFKPHEFKDSCLNGLEHLELKERVSHIIQVLHQFLPADFTEAVNLLIKIPNVWDFGDPEDPLKSFAAWPIIDYLSVYGLEQPEVSLHGLKQLTHLFSAEFAIRPFIIKYPEYCHEQFLLWVNDESADIRRLVSEGTRPKLPWGIQLKAFVTNPDVNIPLLDTLKSDPSLYVRRSVANHLNDIAKDHPQLVIDTCKVWSKFSSKDIDWVIKHATRTLVKSGNTEVFPLLGFTESPQILIEDIEISNNKVKLGESIYFNFNIKANSNDIQKIVIDYAIHFVKSNNKQQAKVFKLKNIKLKPNESIILKKSFSFRPITTRKYYKGEHKIELLVNGKVIIAKEFTVI